jgi:hypothetical protein
VGEPLKLGVGCSNFSQGQNLMKLLLSSLLVCFSITLSYSQTKPPGLPGPQAELLNLIKIWNEDELRGDAVKLAQLLAPEFSFVGGSSRKEYHR